MKQYELVLASASPRRRELLAQIGLSFTVLPSRKEEAAASDRPDRVVQELSRQKAEDIFMQLSDTKPFLVIGADTIVVCEDRILGKPQDEQDAALMLSLLQGRRHQVYTGVTLRWPEGCVTFYESTEVEFYPMTPTEIADYVATGEPLDKAGAYGIQGMGAAYIKGIEGDYNNVVGLPVSRLYQELKKREMEGSNDKSSSF